jgi:hypothetical protein
MSTHSNLQSKDTIWQPVFKKKIQQSVIYKRPISFTEAKTGLGWKTGRFIKPMAPQNRQE